MAYNTCGGGHARCIRSSYYKVSLANFIHTDGRAATCVMEFYDDKPTGTENTTSHEEGLR